MKSVLVTGACGLIGGAICRELDAAGVPVAVASRDGERARRCIAAWGLRHATPVRMDLSSDAAIEEALSELDGRGITIGSLVNNASNREPLTAGFDDITREHWRSLFDVDLFGTFTLSRGLADRWRTAGEGASIVNLSSIYGLGGVDAGIYPEGMNPAGVSYAAAKAAVIGLTRHLAARWAADGIRVNAVAPGGVRSGQPEAFVAAYARRTPAGRMAETHEVSAVVRFLLSDEASYVTGQVLAVDGGWTAW